MEADMARMDKINVVSKCVKVSPLVLPRLNPLFLPRCQVRQNGLISMREKDLVVTVKRGELLRVEHAA